MSTVQMTLGNNRWKATRYLSIHIAMSFCFQCDSYTHILIYT